MYHDYSEIRKMLLFSEYLKITVDKLETLIDNVYIVDKSRNKQTIAVQE